MKHASQEPSRFFDAVRITNQFVLSMQLSNWFFAEVYRYDKRFPFQISDSLPDGPIYKPFILMTKTLDLDI